MGIYLLDAESGAMSVDHQYLAEAIAERYPTVRLAQIPHGERGNLDSHPYALVDANTNDIIRRFKEDELNIRNVFEWLYENDTAVHGVLNIMNRYLALADKEKADQKQREVESVKQDTDFVHWLANNKLHMPKHEGRRYGT